MRAKSSRRLHDFELHQSLCLLLNYDRAIADYTADNNVANPHLDDVAVAKPAINGEIEERAIA